MGYIDWHDLKVNNEYYLVTTGFLGDHYSKLIKIIRIQYLPNDEAMIFTNYNNYGFAVGGKFTRNKFFLLDHVPSNADVNFLINNIGTLKI